jgi:hypothetical protein
VRTSTTIKGEVCKQGLQRTKGEEPHGEVRAVVFSRGVSKNLREKEKVRAP